MITLKVFEFFINVFNDFISRIPIVSNVLDTFGNVIGELSWVTMPTALVNIFRICRCFLPTATIVILFSVGALLIAIQLVSGLVYFLSHLGNIV